MHSKQFVLLDQCNKKVGIEFNQFKVGIKFNQFVQLAYFATMKLMLCGISIAEQIKTVTMHSAKYILRFGQYQNCKALEKMNYNFVQLTFREQPGAVTGYFGLCLPKTCTKQLITLLIQEALVNTKITVKDVINEFEDQYEYTWISYLTLFLIFSIVSFAVFSTWLQVKSKDHALIGQFNLSESMKIFQYKQNNLNVFNGVRSLSMFWVIMGHVYSFGFNPSINLMSIESQAQTWFFLIVEGGIFAVDVFFFIGGFLVAYSVLRQRIKNPWAYPLAILHRALRFWPAYIMTILLYYSIFIHTNSGPIWHNMEAVIEPCSHMWRTLLFVDNLIGSDMCLPWGWYIQNDMQIFVYCMLMLFILAKNKKVGKVIIWASILGSIVFTFVMAQVNGYRQMTHMSDFSSWGSYYNDVYIKPWSRCAPYLFGLILGITYIQFLNDQASLGKGKQNIQTNVFLKLKRLFLQKKALRYGFQILGILIMAFILFIPRMQQIDVNFWPQIVHSFYLALGKVIFVMALSMLILPSLLGVKSWVIFCMDTNFFNFFAKISFCTYLLHFFVVSWVVNGRSIDYYYTTMNTHIMVVFTCVVSMVLGLILVLLVEVPFAKLTKILMEKFKGRKQQNGFKLTQTDKKENKLAQDQVQMSLNQLKINGTIVSQTSRKSQKQ